jgi:predicted ATP-grasp superfamily ATP-dependent carboligase
MTLLIVGASTRAAAFSALRAGLQPWCLDLFADADLKARCPARRLRGKYPEALLQEAADAPPGPWMFTGALENHPALIEALARSRALWGNVGERPRIAEPLPFPSSARATTGGYLVKPRASAGGAGIRFWDGGRIPPTHFLQPFIPGEPASAVFCGGLFLGATRQLIGTPWLNASGFRYAGNFGPIALGSEVVAPLTAYAASLGLRGLFGVDGILAGGAFHAVEVNPRYTASVEVLELASGLLAMAHQAAAFGHGAAPGIPTPTRVLAKGVLYAPADGLFPADGPWREGWPYFADIPPAGSPLRAGQPVLTALATGEDEAGCLEALRHRAAEVQQAVWPRSATP